MNGNLNGSDGLTSWDDGILGLADSVLKLGNNRPLETIEAENVLQVSDGYSTDSVHAELCVSWLDIITFHSDLIIYADKNIRLAERPERW